MSDSDSSKLFKRQSGQMRALDAELQETLEAMKSVVNRIKSNPPPKLKEGGRYHMANPPITDVPLPPNWVTNPNVPKAASVPRPIPKKTATPQPMPPPRPPMRTPSRPHRRKAESFPEIPVELVVDDELLAGLLTPRLDEIAGRNRLPTTWVEVASPALHLDTPLSTGLVWNVPRTGDVRVVKRLTLFTLQGLEVVTHSRTQFRVRNENRSRARSIRFFWRVT